ncbi:MAG: DUF4105 domain-containing protein [Pseudomonadota bacterium]
MISIIANTNLSACAHDQRSLSKALTAGLVWVVFSWLLLAVLAQTPVLAQTAMPEQEALPEITDAASIRMPADMGMVDFYLITVDVGNHVWDNFGHTALRVVDNESGSDLIFNWGMFDTSVGNVVFASNFLRGILNYQLGVSPPGWELGRYEREQRTVWQDRLNLTNEQKATLYRRLAWNLREENIVYSYQYFFDNCTTRVRDYLNEALGGRLESQNRAPTQRTFRDEVMAHYASVPYVAFGLDVLMNERIDRRMTQWEEMFLPARLRQELLSFPSDINENGQRQPMLTDGAVVMEFQPPDAGPNPYHIAALLLLFPVVVLFFRLKKIPLASFSSQTGFTLRSPGLSYRLLGLVGGVVALCSGLLGLVMTAAWLESGHLDLHHNLNLLLFWPTDLIGFVYALRWLLFGKGCTVSKTARNVILTYLSLHLLAMLAYALVATTGLAGQEVGALLLYVVPALLGLTLLVWNAGFSAVRRIRFF